MVVFPTQREPKIIALCEIDLSPGIAINPDSFFDLCTVIMH